VKISTLSAALQVPKEALQLLQEYSADVEARNRMVELVPPGHVILLRPFKVPSCPINN